MKKIINRPEDLVDEMCRGLVRSTDTLDLDERYRIVKQKNQDTSKVCLISGGGSGHEPAHAGFVGEGMLTAAVCGDVFASPSSIQVYNAIMQTQSDAGTLLIIKNYSGDCMNFDAAADMAEEEDIRVEKVYVNDDIAVQDSLHTVGRRGVAGTIFVHKIAGAAAAAGKSLDEVKRLAEKTIEHVKSIGFALSSCTVPAKGSPTFTLQRGEMEFGVGIHGEPGIERTQQTSAKETAKRMWGLLQEEMQLAKEDECAVIVNGLGSTPLIELYALYNDVADIMQSHGVGIHPQPLIGNYMTALEMAGASLTLLQLDDELKKYLDAPVYTPGYSNRR